MRLAVFVDQVFWRDGPSLSTDESYVLFLASLAGAVDEIVLIGREGPEPGRAPYALGPIFSLCPLPYYPDLYRLWRMDPRLYGRIARTVRARAGDWDAILVCGPHPIGQLVARICARRGVPVIPVVRQNLSAQMGAHAGWKRRVALGAARLLEWDFRRLARDRTVFTVGHEMAEAYAPFGRRVYDHCVCLVGRAQFEAFARMPTGTDPMRLICVCRLSPEKGHAVLFAALAALKARGLAFRLDLVGTGAMEAQLRALARTLDLEESVTFHGYVPYGPALFALYGRSATLVLSSLTEGFPQVINEALSMGLSVVATRVGGIPAFLTDGETALLVPPRDAAALAEALARLAGDPALRARLGRQGRALMGVNTLEIHRARILEGLSHEIARRPAPAVRQA